MESSMINMNSILLVEDDPRNVELTLTALEEHHLANKVVIVNDGSEALDYLYRRGKYYTRTSGNPIVVLLTSSRETPDLIEFYKQGVNAYVVKPVGFSEFMQAVKQVGVFGRLSMNRRRLPERNIASTIRPLIDACAVRTDLGGKATKRV